MRTVAAQTPVQTEAQAAHSPPPAWLPPSPALLPRPSKITGAAPVVIRRSVARDKENVGTGHCPHQEALGPQMPLPDHDRQPWQRRPKHRIARVDAPFLHADVKRSDLGINRDRSQSVQ